MRTRILLLIISLLYIVSQSSCKKEDLLTDSNAKLGFSADTLLFDTVFVSIGSVTKNMKIYNTYDQPLKVSNIHLAGGNQSNFRINVNGIPGPEVKDVEIRAGDSLWIFVEVTVDPNNSLLPYILKDSIIFETNGNLQDVKLVAWGQNAHFIIADRSLITSGSVIRYALLDTNLNSTITWDNTLPYVVYGGYAVVDSSQTLIVGPGTQVHFNNNGGLWVYRGGTLKVQGTKNDPAVFQGIRRETFYQEEPGQWDRIWINDGGINEIDYAIIKNGFIGLQTETILPQGLTENLKVTNTIIKNMSGFGLFARNFNITGWNNVIANCGQYLVALTIGGSYDFTQCTFANYWRNGQRSTPAVYVNNFGTDANGNAVPVDLDKADFKNSIIYGSNDNELEIDTVSGAKTGYSLTNMLVKADTKHPTSNPKFQNVDRNSDPKFTDTQKNNFELGIGSAAINKGNSVFSTGITFDLKGNPRIANGQPDLGAYETQ